MTWIVSVAEAVLIVAAVLALGLLAVAVAVVGLALWAGWSRDRYLARIGWKGVSRWR